MDAAVERRREDAPFLKAAIGRIKNERLAVPALLMLVLLTFSNIVLLRNLPGAGEMPSAAAIIAIAVRIGGLAFIGAAILRVMTRSSRHAWRPDTAFWLYFLATVLGLALFSLAGRLMGASQEPLDLLAHNVVMTVLLAPLAPWVVGLAVATPLGLNPARFVRRFRLWLAPLIGWSLAIVSPLALVHALVDYRLMDGVGGWFWPLALLDGALSLIIVLFGFALNSTAYERAVSD